MPDPLFLPGPRTDPSYKRTAESMFGFLDRVSRPELAAPREVLNAWFARWPEDDRDDLRGRLQAKDPLQFTGAFWELYLHETLLRLGYSLIRDPELADTSHRPDFLAMKGEDEFYVEATLVSHPTAEHARRRRDRALIELINEARHPDFFVMLKTVSANSRQPSKAAVVNAIESWLRSLDWETEMRLKGDLARDYDHLEVAGSHIFLRPWPREPGERGTPQTTLVLAGPSSGGVFDEPPHIRADLKAKARRYGRPCKPFIVAILCQRDFASEHDVEQALYGPEVVIVPIGDHAGATEAELGRQPDGLWQRGSDPRATRVSAVVSAIHLHPWSITSVSPRLWLNPWAARPITAPLPWARVRGDLEANVLVREPASADPASIFGIPEDWPGCLADP